VAQSISATVKDLTQRRSASAAEFDEDSIDEGKGCERAALVGLINPVAGRATFECVIHKMLRRAKESLYFVYRYADRYLSLATRGPLPNGVFVRRFERQRQAVWLGMDRSTVLRILGVPVSAVRRKPALVDTGDIKSDTGYPPVDNRTVVGIAVQSDS